MIDLGSLISLLKKNNCNFFTGVPDSVLKELSSSLQETIARSSNDKESNKDLLKGNNITIYLNYKRVLKSKIFRNLKALVMERHYGCPLKRQRYLPKSHPIGFGCRG